MPTVITSVTLKADLQSLTSEQRVRLRDLKLRDAMDTAGLNMSILAGKCAVHYSYISRIVSGERQPSLLVARRMAQALGIPLEAMADILL